MKVFLLTLFFAVGMCFDCGAQTEKCAAVSCPAGKVCNGGECVADCRESRIPCTDGMICQSATGLCAPTCSSTADCQPAELCKDGACVKLCDNGRTIDGNECRGETPECFETADGKSAYCGCREGSCAQGNVCIGTKCRPCPRGYEDFNDQNCRCPAGYASDGKGGCAICGAGQDCNCPADYVSNGKGACVRCVSADDCGKSGKVCKNAGTFDAVCADLVCEAGTYMKGNDCLPCLSGCGVCSNAEKCEKCAENYYADGNSCKSCEARFGTGCGVCSADGKQCDECQLGYIKQSDGSCKKIVCAADEYLAGEECAKCADVLQDCQACSDGKTCTLCTGEGTELVNGKCECALMWFRGADGKCVKHLCPEGLFNDETACRPCPDGCIACETAGKCDVCNEALGFKSDGSGGCVKVECPVGFYRDILTCKPCSDVFPDCAKCSELGTACEQCVTGTLLSKAGDRCLPISCRRSEYLDGNDCKSCFDKFPYCAACDKNGCQICEKYYVLSSGGECYPLVCRADEYLNMESGQCERCPVGFTPDKTVCLPKFCPEGQYLDGDDCKPCSPHCRRCGKDGACRICEGGFGLKEGSKQCEECGDGFFLKGTRCLRCDEAIPYCKECTSDGSACLDCGEARMTVLRKCVL